MSLTERIELVDLDKVREVAQRMLDGMSFNRDNVARDLRSMVRELEYRREQKQQTEGPR